MPSTLTKEAKRTEYLEDAKFELILWRVCFRRRSQRSTKQYLVAHLNKSRGPSATVLVQIVASCLDISITLQHNVYCEENHEYGCMTLLKSRETSVAMLEAQVSLDMPLPTFNFHIMLKRFQLITWWHVAHNQYTPNLTCPPSTHSPVDEKSWPFVSIEIRVHLPRK